MKCDDDTFVRVDSVLEEAKKVPGGRSLYVGNINYHHKPLRNGKWAVTYEVYTISLSHTHTDSVVCLLIRSWRSPDHFFS